MTLIPANIQDVPEGVLVTWLDMQALTVEDPDVGEAVEIGGYAERNVQHSGPYLANSKMTWDFSNEPELVGWFSTPGQGSFYPITPGQRTFLNSRFARPRCLPGMVGIVTVTLFCVRKVAVV